MAGLMPRKALRGNRLPRKAAYSLKTNAGQQDMLRRQTMYSKTVLMLSAVRAVKKGMARRGYGVYKGRRRRGHPPSVIPSVIVALLKAFNRPLLKAFKRASNCRLEGPLEGPLSVLRITQKLRYEVNFSGATALDKYLDQL